MCEWGVCSGQVNQFFNSAHLAPSYKISVSVGDMVTK